MSDTHRSRSPPGLAPSSPPGWGFPYPFGGQGLLPIHPGGYHPGLLHLSRWLEVEEPDLLAATARDVEAYFSWLHGQPPRKDVALAPKNVLNHCVGVRSFHHWAK